MDWYDILADLLGIIAGGSDTMDNTIKELKQMLNETNKHEKGKELNDASRVLSRIEELLDIIEKGNDKDGRHRKELKELCNKLTKIKNR